MHTCFQPEIQEGVGSLSEQEAGHVSRVLRMQPGDQVRLIDGKGKTARGILTDVGRKNVAVAIDDVKTHGNRPSGLVLVVSPTKSTDRFEWLLEKATELGVEAILPVWSQRSIRRSDKHERWAKVIVAATKQSQRVWMPILHEACRLEDVMLCHPELLARPGAVAHCIDSDASLTDRMAWTDWQKDKLSAWLAVGPEGDFTVEEVLALIKHNATPVHLGRLRLRTETAGMAAVAQFLTQDNLGEQDRVVN